MHIGGRNADRTDLLGEKRHAQVAGDHSTAVSDEVIARIDTIAELGGKCVVGPEFFSSRTTASAACAARVRISSSLFIILLHFACKDGCEKYFSFDFEKSLANKKVIRR